MPEDRLVFFNPGSGVEMAFGISSAFPDPNNPFYDAEMSREDTLSLLFSREFSKELVLYCVEQYGEQLPFFQEDPGRKYLQDLDFLLRFWKVENYHTKPQITFT